MAYRDRKNVIWDITMSSEKSVKSRVEAMRRAGYDQIDGVFVDIPVDVAIERAIARYRRGVDQFNAGEGLGGRTVNREVFEGMKDAFTGWSV